MAMFHVEHCFSLRPVPADTANRGDGGYDSVLEKGGIAMSALFAVVDESIGVITFECGKVSPLSKRLLSGITRALREAVAAGVRVIILRAPAGAKVFSAGHDIREIPTNGCDPLAYNDPLRQTIREIEQCPVPVIAMVEGSVWGGACELVLGCDLIVAASDSTFALTPARLGIPYNTQGALNFLKCAGIHLLKEMLFAAEPIAAPRLEISGAINHTVPRAELESYTLDLARRIVRYSPLVHRVLKEEIRVLANAPALNCEAYDRLQALRREVYESDDFREGIRAFQEKRQPEFRGR